MASHCIAAFFGTVLVLGPRLEGGRVPVLLLLLLLMLLFAYSCMLYFHAFARACWHLTCVTTTSC